MADSMDDESEIVFRSRKRQRTQRRRQDDEQGQDDKEQDQMDGVLVRREKKGGVRKIGVAFSSNDRRGRDEVVEELSLVPAGPGQVDAQVQNDRFVKPTGRAGVVEDKHMMEYIDSKLAELRSAKPAVEQIPTPVLEVDEHRTGGTREPKFANEEVEEVDVTKLKKPTHASVRSAKVKPGRRRRGHVRDEKDVARDALIDQIMKESQVPIYDRSTTANDAEIEGEDHDEAVAKAFRAEFLQELEERKRRKPPAAPAGPDKTATGPKLGGSRSQRARYQVEEENKATSSKK